VDTFKVKDVEVGAGQDLRPGPLAAMGVERTAATLTGRNDNTAAVGGEDAGGGSVGLAEGGGHDAAGEHSDGGTLLAFGLEDLTLGHHRAAVGRGQHSIGLVNPQ